MFYRAKSDKIKKPSADSDNETLNSSASSVSNNSCSETETSRRCSNVSQSSDQSSIKYLDLQCRDFKLIRKIGSGDIGKVYLCEMRNDDTGRLYAMKVVDKQVLKMKNKVERAETEKGILRVLDHPFLPKMFAEFDAGENYSCFAMEYCSGGDLHSLRFKQPGRRFSLNAARFYAAEVLIALEYLHMLGIVYRDLKPENILIRSDGHIMLTDFDLSLQSTSSPSFETIVDPSGLTKKPRHRFSLFRSRSRTKPEPVQTRFVAEPVSARSNSFVGTHEYVSPEVASGCGHTNAVDWWAYGIFLYEIVYGETPFVGETNKATLYNVVNKELCFPAKCVPGELAVRNLIKGLLNKDPNERIGSKCGAADVKCHPFFGGLKFALLRSVRPPYVPRMKRVGSVKVEGRLDPERFDCF